MVDCQALDDDERVNLLSTEVKDEVFINRINEFSHEFYLTGIDRMNRIKTSCLPCESCQK
ncbi:MAG: hypothetical protein L6Q53_11535 [Candidatus Brocadia sinica]|nr:hypothetical protein [Candidatus Brocadia sinica]